MKKKKQNEWNEEITIVTTKKKIFLESFIAALLITFITVSGIMCKIIFFKKYLCFIIPMIIWILLLTYLLFLLFYLYIAVKN